MEDPTGDQPKPPAMATYVAQSSFDRYMEAMRLEGERCDREFAQEKEKSDREFAKQKEEREEDLKI